MLMLAPMLLRFYILSLSIFFWHVGM